ncbi:MAG: hypothetical protein U5K79_11865 [Cyclobacteriaceae bacterium]|nr:hypothetical protein [Cyclobacteriaceae bacterium]
MTAKAGEPGFLDGFSDNVAPRHCRQDFCQRKRAGKHSVSNGAEIFGCKGWNFLRAINFGLENYGTAQVTDSCEKRIYRLKHTLLQG